jgi:hypothetical protein
MRDRSLFTSDLTSTSSLLVRAAGRAAGAVVGTSIYHQLPDGRVEPQPEMDVSQAMYHARELTMTRGRGGEADQLGADGIVAGASVSRRRGATTSPVHLPSGPPCATARASSAPNGRPFTTTSGPDYRCSPPATGPSAC